MRRVLNLLQSTHMAHGIVDEESTYLTAGAPLSADVTTVQEWLFNASFKDAYQRIQVCLSHVLSQYLCCGERHQHFRML
jgi:hypothetical protein